MRSRVPRTKSTKEGQFINPLSLTHPRPRVLPFEAYRYRTSRPVAVLALAMLASAGALGTTYGAYFVLRDATESQRLAEPPDLKRVIERAREGGVSSPSEFAGIT